MDGNIFKSVVENIDEAVVVYSASDEIFFVNKKFCKLFGLKETDCLGKSVSDFWVKTAESVSVGDKLYKITTKDIDGYYSVSYLSLMDCQVEKVYSDFISTVSHELRTPLTSIRGFADTMLMSYDRLDNSQKQKFLSIIKEQSNRLIKLVENLLSISKMQVQSSNLVYKAVNVKAQAEQVVCIVKNQYPKHEFVVHCESDVSPILVDESKFQQILINLVDNAAKYSYEKGVVNINIANSKIENYVSIKVEDHGVGIEPENLGKIFEKFSRVENHLTRKTEGSGLGLYIVKNLVEKMGGKIFVESSTTLPNSGSVFEVIFPVASYTNQTKKVMGDK